ncbi:MAG: M15 family metallopeptidase [Nocardioidaceae bacterium]
MPTLALTLTAAVVASACGASVSLSGQEGTPPPPEDPATAKVSPTITARPSTITPRPETAPPASRLDSWQVGSRALPLRPDGFGRVLPTPPELRVRRMPTRDLLPPPTSARFESSVGRISDTVRRRMGKTWSPGCPVPLAELRYVRVAFWGFDERPHTGELVVNARVVQDIVGVFRVLYRARYPIEEMRLVTTADLEAAPSGDGNNTAAFVCRATRGESSWSAHAYGLAVDVNPFLNPYRNDGLVLPELASSYLDRSRRRPGMITPQGVVVDAFDRIGWAWGGRFRSLTDLMHFSASGR